MMTKIHRSGFMWQYSGFTTSHLWTIQFGAGLLAAIGTAILVFAAMGVIPEEIFWKAMAIAACLFLLTIAALLASMLTLIFFWGASHLKLLAEETNE